ncbi:hypothetical protein T01_13865 [Trichinella spiralis]|uniref:Integrase catalytic domain-containing protein n=1 Tax=Trichinella spiralis TaxID=6334 RepID=A0A0V1C259_TRISP|nr:hypothetical protein T01_13865 [Trichinella spiralis]
MDGTLVKRCNCTLLHKLPTMCNESIKTWYELLSWMMLANNNRVHEATRVTPLFASLGKELMLPLDVQLGIASGSEQPVNEFLCSIRRTTGRSQEETVTNSRKKRRQKALFDHLEIHQNYKRGDLVWLAISNQVRITRIWKGSYRIWKEMGSGLKFNYMLIPFP